MFGSPAGEELDSDFEMLTEPAVKPVSSEQLQDRQQTVFSDVKMEALTDMRHLPSPITQEGGEIPRCGSAASPKGSETPGCVSAASSDPGTPWGTGRVRHEVASMSSGLSASQITPLCIKCSYPCDVLQSICKSKASATQHAKFICRTCNRVASMVNRHIKLGGHLCMNVWTTEQRNDFWRSASRCTDESDRLS